MGEKGYMDSPAALESFNVCLLSDQLANRAFLARCLESPLLRLMPFLDASDALTAIARIRPDLVLIDIDSDSFLALDICRQIKADPASMFVPVIAIGRLNKDRRAAFEAGADDYLTLRSSRQDIETRVVG